MALLSKTGNFGEFDEAALEVELCRAERPSCGRAFVAALFTLINSSFGLWLLSLVLVGCAGWMAQTWLSRQASYDEKVDKEISATRRDIDTWFLKMIALSDKPEANTGATYQANIDFYNNLKVNISSIRSRVMATPHMPVNISTTFDALDAMAQDLQVVHQKQDKFSSAF